ncbi:hypothetical protein P153DRAFT_401012 [Dothidotthia symphoricarpi CBS 119687]|uniref:Carbohydrate-binding module family 1 protein n=1 Tax=Dothidotthia symphoricarpi CBS 119687 TaxID=1392245 RepID=A0A6A5ZYL5_9PLEO|nr:uncharacterized protein P153DRAFT_401012 [Dothidotthia symphoricarpi CBS 119687]KAF2124386.1 hypothetical protein P153DRAFT_401012 [Dothidotthia symphoricarpi CBS 119687]
MRPTTLLAPLTLAASSSAWARAPNGVWVANNVVYMIGNVQVHEACTKMNTNQYWGSGGCALG